MAASLWRPLSIRLGRKRPAFEGPADGIPPHLIQPVVDWLVKFYFFTGEYDLIARGPSLNAEAVKSAGILLRVPLNWSRGTPTAYKSLLDECAKDGDLFLDLPENGHCPTGPPDR